MKGTRTSLLCAAMSAAILLAGLSADRLAAQAPEPTMTVPNLAVRAAAEGFVTPIGLAFLSDSKWLVIEKNTGQVQVVVGGEIAGPALDLGVNNFSERGLLGIALHPDFAKNRYVYLFWSCQAPPPPASDPFTPTETTCEDAPDLGADTDDPLAVPLLGNRVDRFVWDEDASTLTWT